MATVKFRRVREKSVFVHFDEYGDLVVHAVTL
jgi:hypothetical protein